MNTTFILFIWNISSYPLIIVVFLHRNVDFDFHWCFNVKNIHASVSFVVFKASVGPDMSKSVGFPSEITTTLARIWRLSIIAECPKIAEIFCKENSARFYKNMFHAVCYFKYLLQIVCMNMIKWFLLLKAMVLHILCYLFKVKKNKI